MSAWIVEPEHIDVLVAAGLQYGILTMEDPGEFGQSLVNENYASVNYRYSENEVPERYTNTPAARQLAPVAVLKALDCYEYQTCQHHAWEASTAKVFCDALRAAIKAAHPALFVQVLSRRGRAGANEAYYNTAEYDVAPWGFSDLARAYAKAPTGAES